MVVMLFGLVVFLGVHILVSLRGVRADLIDWLGAAQYRGFFSLLALSGLGLTAYGFGLWRAAGSLSIWDPPSVLRHIVVLLMVPACLAAVCVIVPSHLRARLKHPGLVTVKIWAFGHLMANGDAASMVLFGSVLAWAVYARIAARRRTESLPSAPVGHGGDVIVVAGGLALYAVLVFWFHPYVIGMPVIG